MISGFNTRRARRPLLAGALTLALANIITRLIGFVYRIFMAGAIGPLGMGLYQLIMPVYSLAWSIACSGITTALSRLVAAESARGNDKNMRRLLMLSLAITLGISAALMLILLLFAPFIGANILNDPRTIPSLRILSGAFMFMAAGSCIRGYFLGLQKAQVPAASQVIEQLARMGIIFWLSASFIPRGLEYAVVAATIGIVAGETLSFIYVALALRRHLKGQTYKQKDGGFAPVAALLSMSLPLTANRVIGSLLSGLENVLIPQRLMLFGLSFDEAMSYFGKITGMAMPLIFFPSALLTALSISLVPSISEAMAINGKGFERVNYLISRSIMLTSLIAFGAGLLFIVFNEEVGLIVYGQDLSHILLILGFMCPFWYLNITFSGILNGLGQQMFIFRNSLLASAINIAFVYFAVPRYGVNAFMLGWFISVSIVTFYDIQRVRAKTGLRIMFNNWFFKPILAALAAGLTINYLHQSVITSHLSRIPAMLFSATLMGLLYGLFVMLLGCITVKDIREIIRR